VPPLDLSAEALAAAVCDVADGMGLPAGARDRLADEAGAHARDLGAAADPERFAERLEALDRDTARRWKAGADPGRAARYLAAACGRCMGADLDRAAGRPPALPVKVVREVLAAGLSAAAWKALDLLIRRAWEAGWPASFTVPAGTILATTLRMGGKSCAADGAVADLEALGLFRAERLEPARGQPSRWRISKPTAGAGLWPAFQSGAVVPWPDALPPTPPRRRDTAAAYRAGFGLLLRWREAAGKGHGTIWAARRGLLLAGEVWREVGEGLDLEATRAAWTEAGWIATDRGLDLPGPALPRVAAMLEGAAERARGRHEAEQAGAGARRRRRSKAGQVKPPTPAIERTPYKRPTDTP
jgi:hypothetical protein